MDLIPKQFKNAFEREENVADAEAAAKIAEFATRKAAAEARVAVESAIAHQIRTAPTVHFEEIYDYDGEGSAGFTVEGKNVTLGLKGKGTSTFKRIYRFGYEAQGAVPTSSKREIEEEYRAKNDDENSTVITTPDPTLKLGEATGGSNADSGQ